MQHSQLQDKLDYLKLAAGVEFQFVAKKGQDLSCEVKTLVGLPGGAYDVFSLPSITDLTRKSNVSWRT